MTITEAQISAAREALARVAFDMQAGLRTDKKEIAHDLKTIRALLDAAALGLIGQNFPEREISGQNPQNKGEISRAGKIAEAVQNKPDYCSAVMAGEVYDPDFHGPKDRAEASDEEKLKRIRELGLPDSALKLVQNDHDALIAFAETLQSPALAGPVSVPEGYKIVPVEPTEEMIEAGNRCDFPVVFDIYKAMIAAAQEKGSRNDPR